MIVDNINEMSLWVGKRKHCSHMLNSEINGIFKRLKSIDKWNMSGHTLDRLEEKGINATFDDIVSAIYNSSIIEYKIDMNKFTGEPEERVVLRAKAIVNRSYNLNAVYSITEKRIITVWVNHIKDKHRTLDWSNYTKDMPVFGV